MEAKVLVTRRDVIAAKPGLYVVQSNSEAYFPALALVEAGIAVIVGEAYHVKGHVLTIRIGGVQENPPQPAKRTITIGAEFFITALKDYNDWPLKWWREAVQNAVDAGSSNVELGTKENQDGTFTVWCDDDGSGMDEDVIINKFLVLGATTKTSSSGAAGGFGKAKELLLLPWIAWKIHSLDTVVEGSGIDYTATTVEKRKGTRLEVVMPADKTTTNAQALAFLEKCNLPGVSFTVDGKTAYANLTGGNIIESVPDKAEVYFIPTKARTSERANVQPYIYVRTRGLYMFALYVGDVPGFLVAELLAPSVEILTANRDGFRDWALERALNRLGERIAKDNLSALRANKGLIRKKYEGTGKFEASKRAAFIFDHIGPYSGGHLKSSDVTVIIGNLEGDRDEKLPSVATAKAMLDGKFLGPDHLEAALKQLVWSPDFYLMNDIEDWAVPKKFYPETMTPTVLKLAKVWAELCRYVLIQLGSNRHFGVGFIFSETTAAAAVEEQGKEGDRESWLMLNPFKDFFRRKDMWRTSDADLKWLYAAAIHECTHVADSITYHDESFASALTLNMAKCADGYRKIKQIVAGVRMRGGPELEESHDTP